MGSVTPRSKGTGSVFFRESDQRWCATLELPSTGTRNRPTRTAKTEAEAKAKLKEMRREYQQNGTLATNTLSVEAWLNKWFTAEVKTLRPKTAANWRSQLERHIIPAIGKARLEKLAPADVRRMTDEIRGKGLAASTALLAHRIVSVALRDAMREGLIHRNVATLTDAPRKGRASLTVLTAADGLKVLQTVQDDRLGSRWAAALLTGARQGELLGLEIERVTDELDLSWQLQQLTWAHGCDLKCGRKRGSECPTRTMEFPDDFEYRHVAGGLWFTRPKSQAGWRIIPLVEPLRSFIELRIQASIVEPNPHGLVWTADPKRDKRGVQQPLDGSAIQPSKDNAAWHAVLKRAGVPDARLHDARHTTASLLLKAGVPERVIMQILGHNSYAVTMGYQNVDRQQLSKAMRDLSARFELNS